MPLLLAKSYTIMSHGTITATLICATKGILPSGLPSFWRDKGVVSCDNGVSRFSCFYRKAEPATLASARAIQKAIPAMPHTARQAAEESGDRDKTNDREQGVAKGEGPVTSMDGGHKQLHDTHKVTRAQVDNLNPPSGLAHQIPNARKCSKSINAPSIKAQ